MTRHAYPVNQSVDRIGLSAILFGGYRRTRRSGKMEDVSRTPEPRGDLLNEVIALVSDPDIRLIILTGEPGVGKTYLLDAVARELGADRAWGVRALADVPLGALAHLIPPAPTRIELIRSLLTRTSGVLCVDDLPDCDTLSQSMVHRLTLEPERTVIATVRNTSSFPQLEPLLDRPETRVIEVSAFPREEADKFARTLLDGELSITLLDEIWDRTEGNPLFASQLIATARAEGLIARQDETWTITRPLPVPSTLRDILLSRLTTLDPAALEAAEYLAALGRVPVARFAGSGRQRALDQLVAAGIVTIAAHGNERRLSATISHPLLAEIAWDRVGSDRRHTLLQEHLAQEKAEPAPNHVRIAVLSLELDSQPPQDALIPALRLASGGFDSAVVERFASAAAAISRGDDFGEAVTAQVGALLQLSRVDEAVAVMADALRRVRPGETGVRLALLQHELLLWGTGDRPAAAAALALQRRRYPRIFKSVHEVLAVAEADGLVFAGRAADALDLIDTRVRLRKRMRPELVSMRSHIRAHALAQLGRMSDAAAEIGIGTSEESAPTADDDASALAGKALVLRSLLSSCWGDPAEAAEVAGRAYRIAQDAGFRQGQAWSSLNLAYALLHVGDLDGAAEWSDRSAHVSGAINLLACRRLALMVNVTAAASAGRAIDHTILAELKDCPTSGGFMLHELPVGEAWGVRAHDPSAADQIMGSALAAAHADGAWMSEARILHEWMRMGRTGLSEQLAALPQGYPLMDARLAFARGLDSSSAELLVTAGDLFAEQGMPLFAAEAFEQAAILSTRSDAASLRARARALLSGIGNPRTPMLASLPTAETLTPRELDIASRARGSTSVQIAEELHLSVRTVENHLARIYRKLGISSRAELPEYMGP